MNLLVVQLFCSDFRYVLTKQYRRMRFAPNERVLRVALLVFSICFGVLSICLVALGAVYTNELGWPRRYIGLDFLELPTLIIILGAVSLVLAIAGCICAKSYSRPLLLFFAITLCVILCLELAIAVIAFENSGDNRRTKTQRLMEAQYYTNGTEAYFQTIEEHYSCCGVTGQEEACAGGSKTTVTGCAIVINEVLDKASINIGYSAVILSILQVMEIGCVFSISMLMRI